MKTEEPTQPKHGLFTAEIRLTKACNLLCKHCSVAAGKTAKDELTSREIKDIIDQLAEMGALYVVFTGGEPLLRKDLFSLVDYASSKGLRVSIDTNGILLSTDCVKALKKAGVATIQISVDGAKRTHDSIRGKGAFRRAVTGIENSLREGVYTTINFTVSRLNQEELPRVIGLAHELGANAITLERFSPLGRGSDMVEAVQSPEEFRKSLELLFAAEDITTNSTDPLAIFVKEGLLETFSKKDVKERICGGCTAGIAALTISYDGEVYPCPKLEISCGNVRKLGLLNIWQNNDIINALRFRELKERCGSCDWKNLCGGCRAVANAVTGDYLNKDPTCFIEAAQ